MLEWSKDEDFWVRRIEIDHQLCRKEKTNTKLLEEILVNNFGSNEFFIKKAIGWSLRDYSKDYITSLDYHSSTSVAALRSTKNYE